MFCAKTTVCRSLPVGRVGPDGAVGPSPRRSGYGHAGGTARPYSWSRVIQQAARRAVRNSPQPPVNNSTQGQIFLVNHHSFFCKISPPLARGAGVTNSRPQASSFVGRHSHPGASPRPRTNPQMPSSNSHPIRTSPDLGSRAATSNPNLKGITP